MPSTEIAVQAGDVAFEYNGITFRFDERRFVDLTKMWRASGSQTNRDPRKWRSKEGKGFIADLALSLNVPPGDIIQGQRGKGGTTSAHWQIAVAYAKYLSHEFHRIVNTAFIRYAEEESNPDLKADRAIEGYRRKGWSDDRIRARLNGKTTRTALTGTLQEHGVIGRGYPDITDGINVGILGGTAKQIKERRGLPKSARTRDHLSSDELTSVDFTEMVTRRDIIKNNSRGNRECFDSCRRATEMVRQILAATA